MIRSIEGCKKVKFIITKRQRGTGFKFDYSTSANEVAGQQVWAQGLADH